jgi:ADP-ribose pyrophosphatase YjhB (NUDIX family)
MKTKRVAVAIITDDNDNVLFGIRNDNNKYTNPGGHLEDNEDPYAGLYREVKEETGLDVIDAKLVRAGFKNGKLVYIFRAEVDPEQEIDPSKDPDKEADIWAYLNPLDIIDELHVPLEYNWGLEEWAKEESLKDEKKGTQVLLLVPQRVA